MHHRKISWEDGGVHLFGFHNSREYLDKPNNYKLFREEPVPWSEL
jgi:hypothetical protein